MDPKEYSEDERYIHYCKINDRTPQSAFIKKRYKKPGGRPRSFVHGREPRKTRSQPKSFEELMAIELQAPDFGSLMMAALDNQG